MSVASTKRKIYKATMVSLSNICMGITIALVFFLIIYVFVSSIPYFSWELVSTSPSYLKGTIGVLPDIMNTIYIIFMALVLVLPMGVGTAIYLNEYSNRPKIEKAIEYCIETLAGIPSIIYGLVGMLVFCQFMGLQTTLLAGALTLMIMNLPTIIRTTQALSVLARLNGV